MRCTKALIAGIESSDGGGFTAIASTAAQDRDGESPAVGCFAPLPPSIPVNLDHTMSAASVIGRAVPYYVGNALHMDADLASTPNAQLVRTKLAEGVLNSVSVVFRPLEWDSVAGVRTCVRAELLAADVASIPSQSEALVLSVRGHRPGHALVAEARAVLAHSVTRAMVAYDLAEAKRLLADYPAGNRYAHRNEVAHTLRRLRD